MSSLNNITVLVPSYKPDLRLLELCNELRGIGFKNIVIVRDGGDASYDDIFDNAKNNLQCHVVVHAINMGKGAALKTGFNYILNNFPNSIGVVTVDADGQHLPQDCLNCATALQSNRDRLVLGCRIFSKDMPLRSRFGNKLTQLIFAFLVGKLSDTQTGLRGIPIQLLPSLLVITENGYEYETRMLIESIQNGYQYLEVPIKTIYIENNRSSHFNPIKDSLKIYKSLLGFGISGVLSFLVDYTIFLYLFSTTGSIIFSNFIARGFSMLFNFTMNKNVVFKYDGSHFMSFIKYTSLCIISISISSIFLLIIKKTGLSVQYWKVFIESLLFFINFYCQKHFCFRRYKSDTI